MEQKRDESSIVSAVKSGQIQIRLNSDIEYLDLVQEISDNIARLVGFDDDALYWIGLSIRESVTNAIQHGNKLDSEKKVEIRFEIEPENLVISIKDEGQGLKEAEIPDPLNPDNLLKSGGRGIFFVRSFMDKVSFDNHPEGGLEVKMEKRVNHNTEGDQDDD